MYDINRAKLGWKIYEQPEALWVKSLKAKYTEGRDLLQAPTRHGIQQTKAILVSGLCFFPRNGRSVIYLLSHPCIATIEDCIPALLPNVDIPVNIKVVADVFDFNIGDWNYPLLLSLFPSSTVDAIRQLPKLNERHEDKLIWTLDDKGVFSVKSVYSSLNVWEDNRPSSFPEKDWKHLWKLEIQDRLKVFLWKCAHAALPFRNTLASLIGGDQEERSLCPLCDQFPETAEHLFLRCRGARVLW